MNVFLSTIVFGLLTTPYAIAAPIASCEEQATCLDFSHTIVTSSTSLACYAGEGCVVEVCMEYKDDDDCIKDGATISHICDGADINSCPYSPADLDIGAPASEVPPGTRFCQYAKPGDTVYFSVKDGNYVGDGSTYYEILGDACNPHITCAQAATTGIGSCNNVGPQLNKEMVWSYTVPMEVCNEAECGDFCPAGSSLTKVTFDVDKNGTDLNHGDYVGDFGACFKVSIKHTGKGSLKNTTLPRIYDSDLQGGADPDLEVGLGNLLIIQEGNNDTSVPDDNEFGGTFVFKFCKPTNIKNIGLVDTEERVVFRFTNSSKIVETMIPPAVANGQWEEVPLDRVNITEFRVKLIGSAGIPFITICLAD